MNTTELKMLQSLPLDIKVAKSKRRLEEFIAQIGKDNVYISFSGGKDSTVLLHLVRSVFPDIVAVYGDTGLEYPEIKEFVRKQDNVEIIRPKMTFKQVIEQYGYPVLSKRTSKMIYTLQNPTERNAKSRKLYLSDYKLDKDGNQTTQPNNSFRLAKKWLPLVDSGCKISDKCCEKLKKEPFHKYEKENQKRPILGTLACESKMREATYLEYGCNIFTEGNEKCSPLGFWTEQDILQYIKDNNLEICSVYGDIVEEDGKLALSGLQRTGCVFCGFGVHLEKGENRYQKLKKTHPKLHDYCMNKLGFKEVCELINVDYE